PMIATLSLIPVAIRHPHSIGWRRFPEVAVKASRLVALFDAKTHAQAMTHFERLGLHIHELHQQARTQIELRKADIERRRWMVGQLFGSVVQYPSPLLGKTYRSQCAPRGFAIHAIGQLWELNLAAGGAFACDETVDLVRRSIL